MDGGWEADGGVEMGLGSWGGSISRVFDTAKIWGCGERVGWGGVFVGEDAVGWCRDGGVIGGEEGKIRG